jgi:hypothetical protein
LRKDPDVLGGKTRVGEPSLVVQSLSILWVAIPISHFPFPISTFNLQLRICIEQTNHD